MNSVRLWFAVAALTASAAVHSHAFLDHADPKVGSVVAVAPGELRIWFTQELEPAFTMAQVLDANGKRVDTGWRVVSVDTHPTEGRFTFRVGP